MKINGIYSIRNDSFNYANKLTPLINRINKFKKTLFCFLLFLIEKQFFLL